MDLHVAPSEPQEGGAYPTNGEGTVQTAWNGQHLHPHAGTVRVPAHWKVKPLRIGELADRTGFSATTIRYYESIGVLEAPPRTPAGYRQYDDEAVDRLAFVRAASAVGLTLGEIRGVVALRERGRTPCGHVLDLIRRRAQDVRQRIAELEALHAELERLTLRAQRLRPADCDPRRICHLVGTASPDPVVRVAEGG